jgi:uncharacterized damage-inducible protein DinB
MANENLDELVMQAMTSRITKILPTQIRACLEELSDEQIWWRPNESSNSIGNLVIHLSGSLTHFIARGIGGMEYQRNRPAEFSERRNLPKEELLSIFNAMMVQVSQTLESFDTSQFFEPTDEPNYNPTKFNTIFNVAIHLATHTGQIVFITKMLKEGAIDEIWIKAHKG